MQVKYKKMEIYQEQWITLIAYNLVGNYQENLIKIKKRLNFLQRRRQKFHKCYMIENYHLNLSSKIISKNKMKWLDKNQCQQCQEKVNSTDQINN